MISQGFKRSNTSLGIITGPCKVGSYVYGNSKQSQKKKESQQIKAAIFLQKVQQWRKREGPNPFQKK